MALLINIDVPDLPRAIAFYTQAFGLALARRLGDGVAELTGWPAPLYLLLKPPAAVTATDDPRRYDRHWTPIHIDIVVERIEEAMMRAVEAGARRETEVRVERWGKIATLADPFGHGWCLIEFVGCGYDEIAAADA